MMKHSLTKTLIISILGLSMSLFCIAQNRDTLQQMLEDISERYDVRFIYESSLETAGRFTGKLKHKSLEQDLKALFDGTDISWNIEEDGHIVLSKAAPAVQIPAEPAEMRDTLAPSRVVSDRFRDKMNSSNTGMERIDASAFNRGYAVLSSPDMIKTLQALPGVASGTELLSGMYVHGGTGYDNLFLLDGVPLYQVSHLAGLFSSFNTDIIDNVDFYKSGFPARYGGRLSSVVDVSTRDGDFHKYSGLFSIGLLDGRLQFEGPIVKGKTSFNVAMRRSWIDVFSAPALAIVNSRYWDEKTRLHYSFGDFNAKVTHLFAPENKLTAGVYYGNDSFTFGFDYYGQYEDGELIPGSEDLKDSDRLKFRWGNLLASLRWQNRLTETLTSDIKAYYTQYTSCMDYMSIWWMHEEEAFHKEGYEEDNNGGIRDISARGDFRWKPSEMHDIRFGGAYEYHMYNNFRRHDEHVDATEPSEQIVTKTQKAASRGHEASVYIEDDLSPADWFKANVGLRYVMFIVPGKTYHRVEPRACLNFRPGRNVSLKLSYVEMNQFAHNLNTSNLDLPTNAWMPSTAAVAPLHSRQASAGVYAMLPEGLSLEVEGWFKTMDHLREYGGHAMLYPPLDQWERSYPEGKGMAYGADVALNYDTEKTDISVAYTLSWTKRKFDTLHPEWFLNWNDNRHKVTITVTHRFSDRFDIYGAWNFKNGNRLGVNPYDIGHELNMSQAPYKGWSAVSGSFYNVQLPPYHRLDLGMNFRKTTKRGNESIWNVSFYNVYCRMNPIYAEIRQDDNGNEYGVGIGIIPIIPSFSYTLKF